MRCLRGYCARCEKRIVLHRNHELCWDCRVFLREQEERDEERKALRFATDEQLERF